MTRRARLTVFLLGAAGLAALLGLAFLDMPPFAGTRHLYRDLAVPSAVGHKTANVVSSVNFDQRALDTLGEETILIASAVGVSLLLRPAAEERKTVPPDTGQMLQATRLLGYVMMPVTMVIGLDLVLHGHVTPGGGFQGGVMLATGLHLLYVTGTYHSLDRLRPLELYETSEAVGAAAFGLVGLTGLVVVGSLFANVLPFGTFGQILSAGTVPVLNIVVGAAVFGGMVVIITRFLDQDITVTARVTAPGEERNTS